jgi:hypothetical protein
MGKKEVLKEAALTLRSLSKTNHELIEKLAADERAERLVAKMVDENELSGAEALQKLSEFKEKSEQELLILEKAFELVKSGSVSLGNLSDRSDEKGMDPLTAYLLGEE